jgi:orotidine-5'-phosphate decarboxylase
VPGYGAQGGGADDVRSLLNARGAGVLVNSSRAILYAHQDLRMGYREAAKEAASRARDELRAVVDSI